MCVDDEMDKKMLILHVKVYDGSCLGLIKDTCYRKGGEGERGGKRREEEGRGTVGAMRELQKSYGNGEGMGTRCGGYDQSR